MEAVYPVPEADAARERMWAEYARSYDRVIGRMPYYQEVVERHLAALAVPGVGHVLDLGAGTGIVTVRLLAAGLRVTAVDRSAAMCAALQGKAPAAAARAAGRLEVVCQPAEQLARFADGCFDAVNVLLVLYAADDPDAVFAEAVRVLRPGGVLVLTEPKRCFELGPILDRGLRHLHQSGLYEEYRHDWERVDRVNRAFDPARAAAMRAEVAEARLRSAGFTGVALTDSHFGYCATVCGRKPTTTQ